ncbi:hypothetical protein FAM09_01235 [Niastella caeni]|uniref:Caspase family protein n=1 Tax=Niastella caeni TaxID=2569763 RepID=A0A4V4H1J5_9BACT|nr:caspase family protein [Niastella caeni]THU40766.1 hypothetical protein FAM09_01235 [Niastella caeni]
MSLDKDKTSLIILGASQFPASNHFTPSIAFFNSKTRILNFFTETVGLPNTANNILDLFDADINPNDIDVKIEAFLNQGAASKGDVFIYYCGHGGFDSMNGGFLLAIRQSRDTNLGVSSVTAQSLGKRLVTSAHNRRLFLIIDCCFAAEIYNGIFQSPVDGMIEKKISSNFPEIGLALLCSSSKDDPSLIVKERNITMFTEGLNAALTNGSSTIRKEYLSLREVGDLTYSYIKHLNTGEAVRPEVHTLIMPNGDIADAPLFGNRSYKPSGTDIAYNIAARKEAIEDSIRENDVMGMRSLYISFMKDFGKEPKYKDESVFIPSDAKELEETKPSNKEIDLYNAYRQERHKIYRRVLDILDNIYPG